MIESVQEVVCGVKNSGDSESGFFGRLIDKIGNEEGKSSSRAEFHLDTSNQRSITMPVHHLISDISPTPVG